MPSTQTFNSILAAVQGNIFDMVSGTGVLDPGYVVNLYYYYSFEEVRFVVPIIENHIISDIVCICPRLYF